jgi:hypothetical protein
MGYKNSTLSRQTLLAQLKLPATCKHSLYGAGKITKVTVSDAKGDLVITCQFGSSKLGFLYSKTSSTALQIPGSQRILYDRLLTTLDDTYRIFAPTKLDKNSLIIDTVSVDEISTEVTTTEPEALVDILETVAEVIDGIDTDKEGIQSSQKKNKSKKRIDFTTEMTCKDELAASGLDTLQNTEEIENTVFVEDMQLQAETEIPEVTAFDVD